MKTNEQACADEVGIVWIEDISRFPYLREDVISAPLRVRSVKRYFDKDGRLIGYAELGDTATKESGFFTRRIWWVADRDESNGFCIDDYVPSEGVNPDSIRHGKPSRTGRRRLTSTNPKAGKP